MLLAGTVVLAGAACSGGTEDGAAGSDRSATSVPPSTATTAAPVATTKAAVGAGEPYTVWFLRDGRLSPGERRTAAGPDAPREAVDALIAGRTGGEELLGLQTGVHANVEVLSWEHHGDTVVVGFNRAFETAQTRPQVAQVVWTLTQFPGIEQVQFLIDGRPNGATGVPPVDRGDLSDIWAPVMVDAPLPGASVAGGALELVGTTAPGATVGWRLEDGTGATVASGGADEVAAAPGPDGRTAWRTSTAVPGGLTGGARLVVFDATSGVEAFPQVVPLTISAPPGP